MNEVLGTGQVEWLSDVIAKPGLTALYTQDGRRIDNTNKVVTPNTYKKWVKDYTQAPETIEVPQDLVVVEEPVIYLGWATPHYGHFLTDSMSRWWAVLDHDLPAMMLASQGLTSNFHREIMDALGMRMLPPSDRPTLYRRLLSPAPAMTRDLSIEPWADRAHLRVSDVLYPERKSGFGKRIFLSRLGYPSKRRVDETSERELEVRLADAGYQIVKPDKLTFAEEIEIFNEAEVITGIYGSAFLTAFFSRKDYAGRLSILLASPNLERFGLMQQIKSYSLDGIFCLDYDAERRILNIDPDRVIKAMGDSGIV